MKKKVLYVSRSYINNSPVGIRYQNFIKYLEKKTDFILLNLTLDSFLYSKKTKLGKIIYSIIRRLPILPDIDVLILKKYKKAIKEKLNKNKINTVIIGVLPVSFLYLAKYIKKIDKNLNVIVDMSDPISAHISFDSLSAIKQKFLLNLEKNCLPYVDILIVLNNEIKIYYEKKYNVKKIVIIEQGIERELKIENKIIFNKINLIYAGHLYKDGREPYELYKAVRLINKKITLNVYGRFKQCFYPPQNEKFHYGGRISLEKLYNEYTKSNIVVFIDNKDTIQVPGKTIEVLALNKPILFIYFNENSPTLEYIKGQKGVFKTKNYSKNIIKAIECIAATNMYYYKRDLSNFYWDNLLNKIDEYL